MYNGRRLITYRLNEAEIAKYIYDDFKLKKTLVLMVMQKYGSALFHLLHPFLKVQLN